MIRKWIRGGCLLLAFGLEAETSYGQEQVLTVEELFTRVQENHPTLQVNSADIAIANQQIELAKNQRLPELSTGLQGYYLGDAHVITKDFSNATRINMPHFGNKFSVEARQLIWKGGAVRTGIDIQSLRKELAELNYKGNEQNVKILSLGYYLDLFKLYNQAEVYRKNIALAEQRIANIAKFYQQGMVTKNDVIRADLQLSNLRLALQVVENNQGILNHQLTVALGLPSTVTLRPDTKLLANVKQVEPLAHYAGAVEQHPYVLMQEKVVEIHESSEKLSRTDMMPSLSAFAGNTLQRPITTANPAVDMYTNGWSAGLSLNFSIDALFKAPKKIQLNRLEREKAVRQVNETTQMLGVAVKSAYVKYNEAVVQNQTLAVNKELTDENYRIMESKYNNQLAILLDLIDASNAKLDAELQYVNSEINIVFNRYKLHKEAGLL